MLFICSGVIYKVCLGSLYNTYSSAPAKVKSGNKCKGNIFNCVYVLGFSGETSSINKAVVFFVFFVSFFKSIGLISVLGFLCSWSYLARMSLLFLTILQLFIFLFTTFYFFSLGFLLCIYSLSCFVFHSCFLTGVPLENNVN